MTFLVILGHNKDNDVLLHCFLASILRIVELMYIF